MFDRQKAQSLSVAVAHYSKDGHGSNMLFNFFDKCAMCTYQKIKQPLQNVTQTTELGERSPNRFHSPNEPVLIL